MRIEKSKYIGLRLFNYTIYLDVKMTMYFEYHWVSMKLQI